MITISTKSLLYRFLNNYYSKREIPNNLCGFVRKVMWAFFLATLGWGLLTFLLTSLLFGMVGMLFLGMSLDDLFVFGPVFVVTSVALAFISIGLLIQYSKDKYYASSYYNKPSYKKVSKPWLITEYYRAVKNKICPMLEFTKEA